jgi:hypothetical protein
MAGSGQIQPGSDHGRNLARRHPAPAVFRWPNDARFQPGLNFDNQPLLDSDNRISNVRVKTKSLILKKVKIVNRFPKIKKAFTVKPKMIFFDYYFHPY